MFEYRAKIEETGMRLKDKKNPDNVCRGIITGYLSDQETSV